MFNLAQCLLREWGTGKDPAAAKSWLEKAMESGDEDVVKDARALLRLIPAP